MKKTYSVSLYFETGITTSVTANDEVEAEQIAIDNFYNKNIKELNERTNHSWVSNDYLYSMELSEYTPPVVEEEA